MYHAVLKQIGLLEIEQPYELRNHSPYAESGGFEPADPLTSQQFSRLPQSTTLPTLRCKSTNSG